MCSIQSILGSVLGGVQVGSTINSADQAAKAAKAQETAANNAVGLQRDIYNQNREDLSPWRQTGSNALKMLADAVGINGQAGTDSATSAFQKSPGYDFAFNEGQRAVDRGMAAKSMVRSGARDKAQTRFGQGTANQEFGGWINKLQTLAGYGQTANTQTQQSGQAYATNTGNLMQDAAAARASGYVGTANAYSSGINNLAKFAGSFG